MRYLQHIPKTEKINLDLKDRKILGLLSENARIPLTQIAKKVGISRDAVSYRIKNYEKHGIIQGYRTIVDITRFGYGIFHLFIRLNNPSENSEEKIVHRLSKHGFIRAIIKFNGNFDFELALIAKNTDELDSEITIIMNDCHDLIQDYEILTITKTFAAETFPPNFYEHAENNKSSRRAEPDKKDIEILKILSEDAILPLYAIGSGLGLSADAVSYRIKNMEKSGIIVNFIPVINYSALSYNLHALLINISSLDGKNEKILKNFLKNDENTLWAVKAIGRYNLLVYFLVKNVADLQNTIARLRSLFPNRIAPQEALIAYEQYKYVYFPKELF